MALFRNVCITQLCLFALSVTALWPQPRVFYHSTSTVWISPGVQLYFQNRISTPWSFFGISNGVQQLLGGLLGNQWETNYDSGTDDIFAAFQRAKHSLFHHRFVPRKFHPRNSTFEPDIHADRRPFIRTVTIMLSKSKLDRVLTKEHGFTASDEAYQLQVSESGAFIWAATSRGVISALNTFAQLFYAHSQSATESYLSIAPILIGDSPTFEHRGVNLDIARNWIAPKDTMRVLDAMAFCKFNKLHLHASDAQSWPLDVPSLPELAAKGAYDVSQVWSPEDLRQVQRHGQQRGIEVYLEIDIPGHTTSVAESHPDLVTAAYKEPWAKYAAEPPAGQLALDSPDVMAFLDMLFKDLVPRNAEASSHFHFGGDEVNTAVYGLGSDPTIIKERIRGHVQDILNQGFKVAKKYKQTPIVWEELLLEWNLTLPSNTIIQTWRSNEALAHVLNRGHRVLFGASTHWYLDCGHGSWFDPANPSSPSSDPRASPPYMDECAPYHNWRTIYSYNPLDGLSKEQRSLVAGGEVHMWNEMTDSVTLDGMLWPRAAAAAEVLWTGMGRPVSEDTTRRLAELRERLVLEGVAAGMVQMEWCLRNKGGCTI